MSFADDIIVVSESSKPLEAKLNDLLRVPTYLSIEVDLELNTSTTKIGLLTNGSKEQININDEEIEYVDNYMYPGKQLSYNKDRNIE